MAAPQAHEDAAPPVAEGKIDTLRRKNIEEVIAMGIRKEKASMVNALAASSSSKKTLSELNAVADTAEVAYPAAGFDWKQSAKNRKF
ncbi:hypothetical protein ACFOEQ_08760 [Chryseobacterium arachidis]|uniref:hypothetical protein n=1 Tax=Chryseobacterium arachidis TaxID=1416778 RepID=UPI00360AD16C